MEQQCHHPSKLRRVARPTRGKDLCWDNEETPVDRRRLRGIHCLGLNSVKNYPTITLEIAEYIWSKKKSAFNIYSHISAWRLMQWSDSLFFLLSCASFVSLWVITPRVRSLYILFLYEKWFKRCKVRFIKQSTQNAFSTVQLCLPWHWSCGLSGLIRETEIWF